MGWFRRLKTLARAMKHVAASNLDSPQGNPTVGSVANLSSSARNN